MNCKNCLNKLVWLAGALFLLSVVYPHGPAFLHPAAKPVTPVTPHAVDPTIQRLLANASTEDRGRVESVYNGLGFVLKRDAGKRIATTEQWAELQANTLQLAIEHPGKYPGLDVAIDDVFKTKVGTVDVLPSNADTRAKLLDACATIASSAAAK